MAIDKVSVGIVAVALAPVVSIVAVGTFTGVVVCRWYMA